VNEETNKPKKQGTTFLKKPRGRQAPGKRHEGNEKGPPSLKEKKTELGKFVRTKEGTLRISFKEVKL